MYFFKLKLRLLYACTCKQTYKTAIPDLRTKKIEEIEKIQDSVLF